MRKIEVWQGKTLLAGDVEIADRFFNRFRGLMLRKTLPSGSGLLLKNCSDIHCFFMRFPIDAVYISRVMTVVGLERVEPWHIGRHFRGAKHVLELPAGGSAGIEPGMILELKERRSI